MKIEDRLKDLQETYDLLLGAVHELYAEVQRLKQENSALKEQLNSLEGEENE